MNPELLYKYLENTATDAEMKQVLDWLDADPAHRRELDELDKVMAASVVYGPDVLLPAPAKRTRSRTFLRRMARYAAELAAVLVVGLGVAWLLTEKRVAAWTRQTTTVEVLSGQYLTMTLQDGTKVWLNSGTRLEYPLGVRRGRAAREDLRRSDVRRRVRFRTSVRGRDFACDVEVLGTKFDVTADRSEGFFSTALLRGSVKVTNRLTPGEQFILKPNEEVRLAGRRLNLNPIGSLDDFLWTEGMISIKGSSFGELMRKFEKSFGVKIRIECGRMPLVDFNHGKIRISDGVDSALRLLQTASDFTYSRSEDDGTIVIR